MPFHWLKSQVNCRSQLSRCAELLSQQCESQSLVGGRLSLISLLTRLTNRNNMFLCFCLLNILEWSQENVDIWSLCLDFLDLYIYSCIFIDRDYWNTIWYRQVILICKNVEHPLGFMSSTQYRCLRIAKRGPWGWTRRRPIAISSKSWQRADRSSVQGNKE